MELTQEFVDRFVGGQLELRNRNKRFLYSGEVAAIELTGKDRSLHIRVSFKWFARKGENHKWIVSDPDPFTVSLLIYDVSATSGGHMKISSPLTGETAMLFTISNSKLDPEKVNGLVLDD